MMIDMGHYNSRCMSNMHFSILLVLIVIAVLILIFYGIFYNITIN